jgi:hypothetical protein
VSKSKFLLPEPLLTSRIWTWDLTVSWSEPQTARPTGRQIMLIQTQDNVFSFFYHFYHTVYCTVVYLNTIYTRTTLTKSLTLFNTNKNVFNKLKIWSTSLFYKLYLSILQCNKEYDKNGTSRLVSETEQKNSISPFFAYNCCISYNTLSL